MARAELFEKKTAEALQTQSYVSRVSKGPKTVASIMTEWSLQLDLYLSREDKNRRQQLESEMEGEIQSNNVLFYQKPN